LWIICRPVSADEQCEILLICHVIALHASRVKLVSGFWIVWYRNEKTDKCLDGTDDGKVVLSSCNTGWTQTWMLYDGTQLQNLRSGGCLEMSPNGNLFTRQCDPKNLFQEWKTYLPHILRNYGTNLCVNYKLRGVGCIYTSKEQIWDRG